MIAKHRNMNRVMKSVLSIGIMVIGTILFFRCNNQSDSEAQRLLWTSEDPLSMPYRTRLQRFERTNLIRNGSFESGRTFAIDSVRTSFVVDGWQQMGEHIEWVNVENDSLYDRDEAFTGIRSVKIVREKAYETDEQGEGILSEFVRVIPGNYDLSFYVRLQDIMPNRQRLGTRLYDAIEVKLLYYDRNKILLDASRYFPQRDQYIDDSDKSLSFANFLNIPSFDWGKITGKSYAFPFPDGDIPSNAYYVKVYLGLKGTGTMWVDSVTLRYTARNFSIAERMDPYTDTSFSMHQIIIPTPKEVVNMESIVYHVPGTEIRDYPVIVVPFEANGLTMKGAILLRDHILRGIRTSGDDAVNAEDIRITSDYSTSQLNDARLVFSLGNTGLYRRYREIMPLMDIEGHEQGYFIYTSNDISNLVFLNGNSETGNYYAVLTAIQLFDRQQPVFHNARVVDFPDFEGRSYVVTGLDDRVVTEQAIYAAEELMAYKFNGLGLDIAASASNQELYRNVANFHDRLHSGGLIDMQGILSDRGIIPGKEGPGLSVSTNIGESMYGWMQGTAERILSTGLDGIIFAPSLRFPSDTSLCYSYPLPVTVNIDRIMDRVAGIGTDVLSLYPGRSLSLIPVLFNNEMLTLSNIFGNDGMNLPDMPVLWSGSSFYSTGTDAADVRRFMAQNRDRKPVFLDNSMLTATPWAGYGGDYPYYPAKLRLYNLFEPFGNVGLGSITAGLDRSQIIISQQGISELDVIRLATAADFVWNTKDYNPDYALWKVLVQRYGADVARDLVLYAEDYAEMLLVIRHLQYQEQSSRNLKNGQDILDRMNLLVSTIGEKLESSHALANELVKVNRELADRFGRYQAVPSAN